MKESNKIENLGEISRTTMHRIYKEDGDLMYDRYTNQFNKNNIDFYNHLCDIDTWKFDKFLKVKSE